MRSLTENTTNQPQVINNIFFCVILIGIMAQQPVLWMPTASLPAATEINIALNYFPRTPPPIFEPDIFDLAPDTIDWYSAGMSF